MNSIHIQENQRPSAVHISFMTPGTLLSRGTSREMQKQLADFQEKVNYFRYFHREKTYLEES